MRKENFDKLFAERSYKQKDAKTPDCRRYKAQNRALHGAERVSGGNLERLFLDVLEKGGVA